MSATDLSTLRGAAGPRRSWGALAVSVVGWVLVTVCLGLAAVPLYGQVTGDFRLVPVLSNSMTPQMTRGDLAWVEPGPTSQLSVGDVLVFNSPVRGSTPSRRVIHRIIEIVDPATIREADRQPGALYVRTKGDSNPDPDPWIAAVTSDSVYVWTRTIPGLGKPLLAGGSLVRVAAFVLAGLLLGSVGVSTLRSALRQTPAEPEPAPTVPVNKLLPSVVRKSRSRVPWPLVRSRPKGGATEPAMAISRQPAGRHASSPAFPAAGSGALSLRSSVIAGVIAAALVGATGVAAAVSALLVDNTDSVGRISAGAVVLDVGRATPVLIADILPGEQAQQVVELRNMGSVPLGRMQLEITGPAVPLLDPTNGLQLTLMRCSVPWETRTSGGSAVASCPGQSSVIVPNRPLAGRSDLPLDALDSDVPGSRDYFVLTFSLPEDAGPDLRSGSATVNITVLGSQRAGIVR